MAVIHNETEYQSELDNYNKTVEAEQQAEFIKRKDEYEQTKKLVKTLQRYELAEKLLLSIVKLIPWVVCIVVIGVLALFKRPLPSSLTNFLQQT